MVGSIMRLPLGGGLSLRFDINEYWVAKVEGHLMDGVTGCLVMDNDIDDFEDDWYMFAAKLSFSF